MAIGKGIYKYLAAEHVLLVFTLAFSTFFSTQTQYIEKRLAEDLGLLNFSDHAHNTCSINQSDPAYRLRETVQQESSIWQLYILAALSFPVLISANVWGALSDKYGRHVAMIVPLIGIMFNAVVNLVAVHFALPLYLLILGSFLQGTFGHVTAFVVGIVGYLSDVTIPNSHERTVRFVMLDTLFTLGTSIGQYTLGAVIETFGFEGPFLGTIFLLTLCAALIIFTLPDRRVVQTSPDICGESTPSQPPRNPFNILRNIYKLFSSQPRRGWLLAGYNAIIFLYVMLVVATLTISILYTTGEPFCLTVAQEGYYQGTMFALFAIGTLFGGTLLPKVMSKFWLMHLASLLVLLSLLLTAFAQNVVMLYVGLAAGLFLFLCTPMSRVSMANLVGPHEQGIVFAFSGSLLSLSAFLSPLLFNAIYSSTLHFMAGFVYLTMCLVAVCAWVFVILLHIYEPRGQAYVSLNNPDETVGGIEQET